MKISCGEEEDEEKIEVWAGRVSFGGNDIVYDVKDGVLETFKNEVSRAVLRQFLALDPDDGS